MTDLTKVRIMAALPPIFWGSSFVFSKLTIEGTSILATVWIRGLLALVSMVPVLMYTGHWTVPDRKTLFPLAALGILGTSLHHLIQAAGLRTTSSGMAGLILAANPVVMAFLSALIWRERVPGKRILGILLASVGVLVMISRGNPLELLGTGFVQGDLLFVLSLFTWAYYSLSSRKYLAKLPMDAGIFWVILPGTLFSTLLVLLFGNPAEILSIAAGDWIRIFYLGVFCTSVSYLLWGKVLQVLPASEAASYMYLNPLTSVVLGWLVLSENVTVSILAGGALILLGVRLANQA